MAHDSIAFTFFLTFCAMSTFDSLYLHLYRFRLHRRRESLREHWMHTLEIASFLPILFFFFFFFVATPSGWRLWCGVLASASLMAVEAVDMSIEKRSRAGLGGLPSYEYVLHACMIASRLLGTGWFLASRTSQAWLLEPPPVTLAPQWIRFCAGGMLLAGVIMVFLHVFLTLRKPPYHSIQAL